jgi:anthranilate phosphoribosyltransferase
VRGGNPDENAAALRRLLDGEPSAYRDIVILNAALALQIADIAATPKEGAERAAASIDNGNARAAFERLRSIVNS